LHKAVTVLAEIRKSAHAQRANGDRIVFLLNGEGP
jgi:hypothetical protein